jgi:fucose 4-O-acetylase-like acetyltransferase
MSTIDKQRNIEMDILKGIGIILVVMGHYYTPFPWFHPYSFHMPLFFFASGYFYNQKYENEPLLLLKKRSKSLLLPYLAYSIVLGLIVHLINWKYGVKLFIDPSPFSPYNFFVMPFISSHHNSFFLAGWFITQLFIIHIFFTLLYKLLKKLSTDIYFHLIVFALLCVLGTYLALQGFSGGTYKTIISRTLFGTFFYFLGYYYRYLSEANINIFKTKYLIIIFCIQIFMLTKYGDVHFYMVWSDFLGSKFIPIIASVNGIYLYLFISKALSKIITENDILVKIGQNSLHILAFHLFIFFIVNLIWIKMTGKDISLLSNVFFRDNQKYWLLYVGSAVLVPTFGAMLWKVFWKKVTSFKSSKKLKTDITS